jgi:microcin C transport system substrate-binding protein
MSTMRRPKSMSRIWWLAVLMVPMSGTASIEYRYGHSMVFELKYPPDFPHFEYVNPNAPKGGAIRAAVVGTFSSFNHMANRGRPAAGLSDLVSLLYDRLLYASADEPSARYGLLAEGVAWAEDYTWIAFKLREGARWHDGEPITAADVIFTFQTLKEHGSISAKTNLLPVLHGEELGEREVLFTIDPNGVNNELAIEHLGRMDILPKHYWEKRDPSRTTAVPPLGSGPYEIADYRMGRYVNYRRNPDYWARDLPVLRGRFNFEYVKFDYFRDLAVLRQALKNAHFDLAIERVAKHWTLDYEFPAADAGLFRKVLVTTSRPAGFWAPIYWNVRRDHLQDVRVREALWLLFDFRFMNRVLMYDYYDYGNSYFHGSRLAHSGLPSPDELVLLEPLRGQIPERVFTQPFMPPDGDGYGYNRDNVRRALQLLAESGWHIRDGALVQEETGRRFRVQFILSAPPQVRLISPYVETLQRVGIDASARAFEQSNFLSRVRNRQYDGGIRAFIPSSLPGQALNLQFSSRSADVEFGLNWAGIRDPAVDYLIERIIDATDEQTLLAATRAFDRVMLWNFYLIPGMSNPWIQYLFWDRFGIPDAGPLERAVHLEAWWFDQTRSRRVDEELPRLPRRTPSGKD